MIRKRVHWGQTPFRVKDDPEIGQLLQTWQIMGSNWLNSGLHSASSWLISGSGHRWPGMESWNEVRNILDSGLAGYSTLSHIPRQVDWFPGRVIVDPEWSHGMKSGIFLIRLLLATQLWVTFRVKLTDFQVGSSLTRNGVMEWSQEYSWFGSCWLVHNNNSLSPISTASKFTSY